MTFPKSSRLPQHHPGAELLMDYAAGSLPEPVSLLVASHVSLCRNCQAEVARLEALGGTLLESLPDAPLDDESLERALARLDVDEAETPGPSAVPPAACADPRVPRPLRDYLDGDLDSLPWKSYGAVSEAKLLPEFPGIRTRLLRIKAGTAVPQHSHEGREFTLLLAGGFSDQTGHYLRGDVAEADPGIDHRPLADAGEDCICLAVTDAPLRLTGRFGRYLNPLFKGRL